MRVNLLYHNNGGGGGIYIKLALTDLIPNNATNPRFCFVCVYTVFNELSPFCIVMKSLR